MRKLPLVIIFCLICSLILPPSALGANTEYDHEALMEYEGYGQAIYETLVEETAYITGQYTNNKEYVNKSIDQVKDYAKFWWGEAKELNHASLQDVVSAGGGYFLTIGDWFKKMFGGYEEKYYPPVINSGIYDEYIRVNPLFKTDPNGWVYGSNFRVMPLYEMTIGSRTFTYYDGYGHFNWGGSYDVDALYLDGNFSAYGQRIVEKKIYGPAVNVLVSLMMPNQINGDFANVVTMANIWGVPISFKKIGEEKPVVLPSKPSNDDFDRFKKYLDEKLDKIATPQPKPYLVCPNGSKIQMSVSGSTFLNSDGTVTVVNKDGTAQVDNVTCQLGWEKPEVKYINDRAAIQTPDGKWQDAETGKAIVEKEPEKPTEPSNPSCNDSDNMEVNSGQCEGVPYFGSKLEFIFGNATGNKNHIERSLAMELQLNSIGIFDDAKGKKLVLDNLSNAFDDSSSIRETLDNGQVVRTSVLTGPNGELKVESVWDKEKLISVKLGEDLGEVISKADRDKLNNWTYKPDDQLYLKYKNVFDNSKYYNQDTGSINWPENDGFSDTPKDEILQPGFRIDRYGYDSGTFVSPEGTPYGMRAVAPGTDLRPYSVFEVVIPLEVKGGQIAPWFDEVGGGIQYVLSDTVEDLLGAGIIRRVTP